MNDLIKLGKKRTLLISLSILLVSIHTIYFYNVSVLEIEPTKLLQQFIRFLLTIGLLLMVYKGKNWARIIAIILFAFGILGAIFGFITTDTYFLNKTPFLVMIFVYGMAVYHFSFSKSFKAFFESQKTNITQAPGLYERQMQLDKFWQIVETSNIKSHGDYEQQQEQLKKELLLLNPPEIVAFNNTFKFLKGSIYNWDFWAAAYIINGGCSDDCFSDFRGWLIGRGKQIFDNAVQDIESLATLEDTNDGDWEGLSYVPSIAFEEKTGIDMPIGIRQNMIISGDEWDEEGDDLKNKYPKLWMTFEEN
ncbi:DUF4240 domain-containing protein [uncultured Dokdonia sp.]|uniref:DUF4240 domain-containing protein n=1 Tax=Dokdonia sp. R78006 TaxID=3093866 RepID=UPI0026340A1C|nr:DUF4240 domain-containing protein [uncultured Dokdonia sp.]